MSVVPDSSLREQLEAVRGRHDDCQTDWCAYHVEGQRECDVVWLLAAFEAGLAAARADEREKIAKAIETHRARGFWAEAFGSGYSSGLTTAARLARSAGVEPKEQQT